MTLYNFSHFIQIWLFPPGLLFFLLMLGFLVKCIFKRLGRAIIIFTLFIFWLLCAPVIAQILINKLQQQYPPLNVTTITTAVNDSAIVVLGSGIENADEFDNKHTLSDRTLSRLYYAAYLHNKTQIPIITSGGNRDNKAYTEADLMRETLNTTFNITTDWTENKSHNTEDESRLLLPLLQAHDIKTIYLITNAWHMPRSMATFQRAFAKSGINIIAAPMGYITIKSDERLANYLPLINAMNTSALAMHEYVGMIWYKLFYGV